MAQCNSPYPLNCVAAVWCCVARFSNRFLASSTYQQLWGRGRGNCIKLLTLSASTLLAVKLSLWGRGISTLSWPRRQSLIHAVSFSLHDEVAKTRNEWHQFQTNILHLPARKSRVNHHSHVVPIQNTMLFPRNKGHYMARSNHHLPPR